MPGVLENGEVSLFFKLLDSLNESLKTLATKYELLAREMERQDKLSASIDVLTTKVVPFLVDISKGIEEMRHIAPELKVDRATQIATLQDLLKNCKDLEQTMGRVIDEMRTNKEITITAKKGVDHVDSQVDEYAGTLSSIQTKMEEISKIPEKIEALRKEIEPTQKLVDMVRKPLTIILIIYGFVATVISVNATAKWIGGLTGGGQQDTPVIQKVYIQPAVTTNAPGKNGP